MAKMPSLWGIFVYELVIPLLGPLAIKLNGQKLTFESSKAVALLAYLAVTESSHHRAALAALLWPESNSTRARNALRYTLSLLKKSVPAEHLKIERQDIDLARNSQVVVLQQEHLVYLPTILLQLLLGSPLLLVIHQVPLQ